MHSRNISTSVFLFFSTWSLVVQWQHKPVVALQEEPQGEHFKTNSERTRALDVLSLLSRFSLRRLLYVDYSSECAVLCRGRSSDLLSGPRVLIEKTEEEGRLLQGMRPEEARQAVVDTLKRIDANSDGALSSEELFAWLRRSYGCASILSNAHTRALALKLLTLPHYTECSCTILSVDRSLPACLCSQEDR